MMVSTPHTPIHPVINALLVITSLELYIVGITSVTFVLLQVLLKIAKRYPKLYNWFLPKSQQPLTINRVERLYTIVDTWSSRWYNMVYKGFLYILVLPCLALLAIMVF